MNVGDMSFVGKFYSIKELADKMRVHPNTIRRAIKFGRIQAIRIGTGKKASYRISENEIVRMAEFDITKLIERIIEEKIKS